MWQRFTERARKVVFYAQEEAQRYGEGYVSTEHLLLGLLKEGDTLAVKVLDRLGISSMKIRGEVERQLPRGDARASQDMTLTPRGKRVIDLAYQEARNLNNNYIGTEHILLGLLSEGEGLAGRVLAKFGIELAAVRAVVQQLQDDHRNEGRESWATGGSTGSPPGTEQAGHARPGSDPEFLLCFLMGRSLPQHLMIALAGDAEGLPGKILRAQCAHLGSLQWDLWGQIVTSSQSRWLSSEPTILASLLQIAVREANGGEVKPHHLLLALLHDDNGEFTQSMGRAGITLERSRELVAELGG